MVGSNQRGTVAQCLAVEEQKEFVQINCRVSECQSDTCKRLTRVQLTLRVVLFQELRHALRVLARLALHVAHRVQAAQQPRRHLQVQQGLTLGLLDSAVDEGLAHFGEVSHTAHKVNVRRQIRRHAVSCCGTDETFAASLVLESMELACKHLVGVEDINNNLEEIILVLYGFGIVLLVTKE